MPTPYEVFGNGLLIMANLELEPESVTNGNWESQGLREFKQTVEAQVTHGVGLSWIVARASCRIASTVEIDNLTDAKVFDNFGVQRPGRAFYFKVTGELR